MTYIIDLTRTGDWMVTFVPGTTDKDGDQDREHVWCKDKKELVQYLVKAVPEIKK